MGKKLSQASMKVSKSNDHKKQQLNSLIKVLRPKVYITSSASFKNLVQELTGNGNIPLVSSSSSFSFPSYPSQVIEIEDDIATTNTCNNSYQESSPGFSSSELSVPAISYNTDPSLEYYYSPEEMAYHQSIITNPFNEFGSSVEDIDHFTQYRDVESWLLDMDPSVNSNYEQGYVPSNVLPEARCMYDYGLTGMIM